jgi:hypothetical protein
MLSGLLLARHLHYPMPLAHSLLGEEIKHQFAPWSLVCMEHMSYFT